MELTGQEEELAATTDSDPSDIADDMWSLPGILHQQLHHDNTNTRAHNITLSHAHTHTHRTTTLHLHTKELTNKHALTRITTHAKYTHTRTVHTGDAHRCPHTNKHLHS